MVKCDTSKSFQKTCSVLRSQEYKISKDSLCCCCSFLLPWGSCRMLPPKVVYNRSQTGIAGWIVCAFVV